MKKLINLLFLIFPLSVFAEDVLQVTPMVTTAGLSDESDDAYIELVLVNDLFDVANLQFDILFPEGMEYADYAIPQDRLPSTTKKGTTTWDFSWQSEKQDDGYTRFMFIPGGDLRPIEKGTGAILQLNFSTAATMAPGVYPVLVKNVVLSKTETEDITIEGPVASYIVISEDGTSSVLQTEASVDLSGMTGYIPSFVVEALSTDLAANPNLKSVDLSGATSMGGELTTSAMVSKAGGSVSYEREFEASLWSTVCLPFALSADQVSAIKAGGCEIEQLTAYDEASSTITFEAVDEMAASTPYLVKCSSAYKPFADLSGVSVSGSETPASVTVGNLSMKGTFEKLTLSSSASTTYYGYKEADGALAKVGSNATVKPYRAYLELTGAGARELKMIHADGTVTAIKTVGAASAAAVNTDSYDLQGRKLAEGAAVRGIYVKQGKKYVK